MKEDEIVCKMFSRLAIILNEFKSLGNTYITHERARKIMISLPKYLETHGHYYYSGKELKRIACGRDRQITLCS